jgi:hypothetical protein
MAAPDTGKSSGEVLEVGPGSDRSNELTRSLIANHKHDSHGGNPESHEGPNPDAPESFKPPSANQEVTPPEVVPAAAPDTILGAASDEIAPDGQNFSLSGNQVHSSGCEKIIIVATFI